MLTKTAIRLTLAALVTSTGCGLASCEKTEHPVLDIDSMVDCIPVRTGHDSRWGMITVDGKLVFEDEFVDEPTLAINNVLSVSEHGLISAYTVGDQPKLLGQNEGLSQAGILNEGRMPVVRKGCRIMITDQEGDSLFTINAVGGREIVSCAKTYSDGLLVVADEAGRVGCIDRDGAVVIPPKYASLSNFSMGYSIAKTADTGRYRIIDTTDATVCDVMEGYTVTSPYITGREFLVADSTGTIGIMALDGALAALPSRVREVGWYDADMLTFCDTDSLWGIMSRKGGNEVLMRPKFRSIDVVGKDEFLVNLDGRWAVVDIKNKKKIDFNDTYREVVSVDYPGTIRYFAKDNVGWVILDSDGREIVTDYSIHDFGRSTTIGGGVLTSEYFDIDTFVNDIVKLITHNSLAGIEINSAANGWYDNQNPDDYSDRNEFEPAAPAVTGFGYKVSVVGVTDRIITALRYNPVTYALEYYFVPNNKIYAVELIVDTTNDSVFRQTINRFIPALEMRGYDVVDQDDESVTLKSERANLEISSLDTPTQLSILMFR